MLTFLLYWLFYQYVLLTLHHSFLPTPPVISAPSLSETIPGYYRCPSDYLLFPDQESLLMHWQMDHPALYEGYQVSEEAVRQEWLESMKIQKN